MKKTIFSLALMIALGFTTVSINAADGEIGHGNRSCQPTAEVQCPAEDGEIGHGNRSAFAGDSSDQSSETETSFLTWLTAYIGF
jgi:hypothetical protein